MSEHERDAQQEDGKATWEAFRDRVSGFGHYHRPLLPLIEYILERPHMRRFYYFTSHDNLVFSWCSEYPFYSRGLPTVTAPVGGTSFIRNNAFWAVQIDPGKTDLYATFEESARAIERILRTQTAPTWRGNAEVLMRRDLDEALANLGRPERLELRGSSLFVEGTNVRASRMWNEAFCTVQFAEDEREGFDTWEEAAEAIVAWLDANG